MNERELFLAALDIDDPAERQAFLQDACSDNPELLRQVESLLASHEAQSQFLDTPVVEQLTEEPIADGGATVLLSGAVADDMDDETAAFNTSGANTMASDGDDSSDEIPLGYLSPSSREDSLGRLGHYEILEVVGSGAFGTVLKAFDEKLHRVVAIKVLAPEMASTSPARKRFSREARSSAKVRHENVVQIYAVEDEPIPYLVMEYIPGQTLQQRLDGTGPLSIQEVLRIGKQIADGLAAAHAQELIHRDIKPGNILLDTSVNDHVKITDFGLARTADDASMTQSGMIAGTPLYMAPEQALGQKLDQRADLFSFGSVLYQMLSGRPPFRAPNTVAVLKRVVEDAPRPIQEIIPEVPQWVSELIGHLHAKDPDQRYSSARDVSEILAQCLADVQEGRQPRIPTLSTADTVVRPALPAETRRATRTLKKPPARLAAIAVVLMVALGFTEATGVTELASTVVRLFTGSGTLVIELDDPTATVAVNGEEVTIVAAAEAGINLIQLLDPERDFLDDRLKIRDGKLITPQFKGPGAIGMIPYGPVPDSYDIRLRLQRLSNDFAGFNFGIVVGGRQVCVGMDCGFKEKVWGLDFLDGKAAHVQGNPTRNPGRRLIIGQTSDVTIQVRKNHVTASCDGEVVFDWTGDPELLSVYHKFDIPQSDSLFFVAQADFIVHEMALISRSAVTSQVEANEIASVARPSTAPPTPTKTRFDEAQAKQYQQAWADYLGVPVEKDVALGRDKDGNDVKLTMVLIPPGEFMMGTASPEQKKWLAEAKAGNPAGDFSTMDMEDQHFVRITKPFWISKDEFTRGQFRKFVERNDGYITDAETNGKGGARWNYSTRSVERKPELNWDNWVTPNDDRNPVVNVSWNDAAKCCEWLSSQHPEMAFALPTEAQWEFACRAGTSSSTYDCETREQLREYAQFGNEVNYIHRGRQLRPNAFGLHDMLGNVTEWCSDWIVGYGKSQTDDPSGPSVPGRLELKAVRGGSFIQQMWHVRSSKRDFYAPDDCFFDRGFRVAAAILEGAGQTKAAAQSDADKPKDIGRSAGHESAGDDWIDVNSLIDPQIDSNLNLSFLGKNEWQLENGELTAGFADDKPHKLVLPLDSDWSAFELDVSFTRRKGMVGFAINIPTSRRDCPLFFDWVNHAGFWIGNAFKSAATPAALLAKESGIKSNQQTSLRVQVRRGKDERDDHVTVFVDGSQVSEWSGDCDKLALDKDEYDSQHRRLSIYIPGGGSEFVFHSIRVRMLDGGTADALRPVSVSE